MIVSETNFYLESISLLKSKIVQTVWNVNEFDTIEMSSLIPIDFLKISIQEWTIMSFIDWSIEFHWFPS